MRNPARPAAGPGGSLDHGQQVARVGGAATGSDTLGGLLCLFGVHQKPEAGSAVGEAHHAHNLTGLIDNRAATAGLLLGCATSCGSSSHPRRAG